MTGQSESSASDVFFLDDVPTSDDIGTATFTITELATEFGIAVRMIQHYEACGLLHPQRQGEQRIFGQRERLTLEQIVRAQRYGLSLGEIAECLTGAAGPFNAPVLMLPPERCRAQIEMLRQRRSEIDRAIRDLENLMQA